VGAQLGRAGRGRCRQRDLGLAALLHHQHAVLVGDLDRLHDLPLAQHRVDVGLGLLLEGDGGEQVAAGALRRAAEPARQPLGLAAGLEQGAVELALRERAEDQPGEQPEVEQEEEADQSGHQPEPARGAQPLEGRHEWHDTTLRVGHGSTNHSKDMTYWIYCDDTKIF
jgi:hypothetical protein